MNDLGKVIITFKKRKNDSVMILRVGNEEFAFGIKELTCIKGKNYQGHYLGSVKTKK